MIKTNKTSSTHRSNHGEAPVHEHVLLAVTTTFNLDDMDSILVAAPQVAGQCGLSEPVTVGLDLATLEAVVIFTLDTTPAATVKSTAELAGLVERQLRGPGFPPLEAVECLTGLAASLIQDYWAEAASLADERGKLDLYRAATLPAKPTSR